MPTRVYLLQIPGVTPDEDLENYFLKELKIRLDRELVGEPVKIEASKFLSLPDDGDMPPLCLTVIFKATLLEKCQSDPDANGELNKIVRQLRAARINSHIFAAALFRQANVDDGLDSFRGNCRHWTDRSVLPIGSIGEKNLADSGEQAFTSFRIGKYWDTDAAGSVADMVHQKAVVEKAVVERTAVSGDPKRPTVLVHGETAARLPPALSDEAAFFAKPIDKRGEANRFGHLVRSIFRQSAQEDTAGGLPVFVVSGETQQALVENLDRLEEAGDKGSLQLIAEDRRPFLLAVRTAAEYRPEARDVADVLKGRQPAILVDPLEDPVPELDEHVFYFVARVPEDVAWPARSGNSGFVRGLGGEAP